VTTLPNGDRDPKSKERNRDTGPKRLLMWVPIVIVAVTLVGSYTGLQFQSVASAEDIDDNAAAIEQLREQAAESREQLVEIKTLQIRGLQDIREILDYIRQDRHASVERPDQ
jgi:flagellar basal body-associated protein FliL